MDPQRLHKKNSTWYAVFEAQGGVTSTDWAYWLTLWDSLWPMGNGMVPQQWEEEAKEQTCISEVVLWLKSILINRSLLTLILKIITEKW